MEERERGGCSSRTLPKGRSPSFWGPLSLLWVSQLVPGQEGVCILSEQQRGFNPLLPAFKHYLFCSPWLLFNYVLFGKSFQGCLCIYLEDGSKLWIAVIKTRTMNAHTRLDLNTSSLIWEYWNRNRIQKVGGWNFGLVWQACIENKTVWRVFWEISKITDR